MKHIVLTLALSASFAFLLAKPALAQISESDLAPAAETDESDANPVAAEADPSADTAAAASETEPAPAETEAAPPEIEASAEAASPDPVETAVEEPASAEATSPDPVETTPPLAEEPTAEESVSSADLDLFLKRPPTPFDQGRLRLGIGLGWTSTSRTDWLILGAGLGFYVIDGLEVALDSTFWVVGDPFVATLTPGLRYVFIQLPSVKPYIGAFYRHYFVGDGYDDTDSLGGRLGVYFMLSKNAYIGGGIVYEHFLDDDLFASRDQFYPETHLLLRVLESL